MNSIKQDLSCIEFSQEHIAKILHNLNFYKACGPDNLPSHVLKKCATVLAPSLAHLFTRSFNSGCIPAQWKQGNVVPVHEKGDKSQVCNYRPISLLCIESEVMEKCLYSNIIDSIKPLIHPLQHGFMNGKSCTTQLLVYENVGKCLDHGKQMDMIFLDFSKAFDSVNHTMLLHKLKKLGFSGKLFDWLSDYPCNRNQRVVLNGCTSEWIPVTSGVPQVSILGPLLFLLFINDMPDSAKKSILAMFADDAKCFRRIVDISDCMSLQNDFDELYRWSKYWKLNFNSLKCKVISFTRNSNLIKFVYKINGEPLLNVCSFYDLGVTFDSFLTHNVHIKNAINKCNKVNGMKRRAVGYKAPASVTLKLYKALNRPIAEYSSPVWSPFYKSHIELIERIQRNFTRYAMHYRPLNYKDRCVNMNIFHFHFEQK